MNAALVLPPSNASISMDMVKAQTKPISDASNCNSDQNGQLLNIRCRLLKASDIILELCRSLATSTLNEESTDKVPDTVAKALDDACEILKASSQSQKTQRDILQVTRQSLSALVSYLPHLTSKNIEDDVIRSGILKLQLAIIEVKLVYEELASLPIQNHTSSTPSTSSSAISVSNPPAGKVARSSSNLTHSQSSPNSVVLKAPKQEQSTSFLHSGRIAVITATTLLESLYSCLRKHPSLAAFTKAEKEFLKPAIAADSTLYGQHRRTYSDASAIGPNAIHGTKSSALQAGQAQKQFQAHTRVADLIHTRNMSESQIISNDNLESGKNTFLSEANPRPSDDESLDSGSGSATNKPQSASPPQIHQTQTPFPDEVARNRQVRFSLNTAQMAQPGAESCLTLDSVATFERLIEATKNFDKACSKLSSALHGYVDATRVKRQGRSHSVNEFTKKFQPANQTRKPRLRRIHSSFSGTTNTALSMGAMPSQPSAAPLPAFPIIKRKISLTSTLTPQGTLLLHGNHSTSQTQSQKSLLGPSVSGHPHSPLSTICETSDGHTANPSTGVSTRTEGLGKHTFQQDVIATQQSRSSVSDLASASEMFLKAMIELSKISKEPQIISHLDKPVLESFKTLTNTSRQLAKDLNKANISS